MNPGIVKVTPHQSEPPDFDLADHPHSCEYGVLTAINCSSCQAVGAPFMTTSTEIFFPATCTWTGRTPGEKGKYRGRHLRPGESITITGK
jgi:hypothetical protein